MLRKHKKFARPKKPFDINRIKSENLIVVKYGLKNKREIWKARAKLNTIRRRAKKLINESSDVQEKFVEKLNKLGYKVGNVVEVLALTEEDILSRRLQTILYTKKLATTARGARQLITHKQVKIKGVIVNIPSYNVEVSEENKIELIKKQVKTKAKETPVEEIESKLEVVAQ